MASAGAPTEAQLEQHFMLLALKARGSIRMILFDLIKNDTCLGQQCKEKLVKQISALLPLPDGVPEGDARPTQMIFQKKGTDDMYIAEFQVLDQKGYSLADETKALDKLDAPSRKMFEQQTSLIYTIIRNQYIEITSSAEFKFLRDALGEKIAVLDVVDRENLLVSPRVGKTIFGMRIIALKDDKTTAKSTAKSPPEPKV